MTGETWEAELVRTGQEHWVQRARLRRAIQRARLNGATGEAIGEVLNYSPKTLRMMGFGGDEPRVGKK